MYRRKLLILRNFILLLPFVLLITACQESKQGELPLTGTEPLVIVSDQVSDGRTVMVEEVLSSGPGWLVVYTQRNGKLGSIIGYSPVRDGLNKDVVVRIDPELATEVMYAALHTDAGEIDTFEFPGPDVPAEAAGQIVSQSFTVNVRAAATIAPENQVAEQAEGLAKTDAPVSGSTTEGAAETAAAVSSGTVATPGQADEHGQGEQGRGTAKQDRVNTIQVADQAVEDGVVVVEEATSNGPGWVVIYSEQDGQPVEVIGFTAVEDGENRDIAVKVDENKLTPELYALLHTDAGQIGTFEYPGPDTPVLSDVRGILDRFEASSAETVSATPSVEPTADTTTLRVVAVGQPVRGGTVKVAEVVSEGPGWLGIHLITPDGKIGSAIGSALVQDGLNRDVVVKIDYPRATGVMNAMLHHDGGKEGVWEFPGPDAPVMVDDEMVMVDFNVTGGLVGQEVVLNITDGESPFLTDDQGMSLYVSLADKPNRSLCDAECHKTWLPLLATGPVTAGAGVDISKLGVTVLTNGDRQVTYNSLPLYYYAGDSSPGDTQGQGIDGQWFLSAP